MQTSEHINELATALAKAQGEITGALKDSANPFFKSKYADLASCWDACREPLSKNGLSIVQTVMRGEPVTIAWDVVDQESGEVRNFHVDTVETVIVTMLLHASGQWIRSHLPMIPRDASPQGVGSAITYGRRYGLTAMIGVAQVDDDGNQGSGIKTPSGVHSPKGEAYKSVPVDTARTHALAMMGIITAPAKDGDHDELQKCLTAYDYHLKHLAGNNELYIASAEQMDTPKRNIWKTMIAKAKEAEKADRAASNYAGRRA
jgi:hypothetical protein